MLFHSRQSFFLRYTHHKTSAVQFLRRQFFASNHILICSVGEFSCSVIQTVPFFPMYYCLITISTIRRCMPCKMHKPKIQHKLFQAPVSNQARSGGICTLFILCGHLSKHLHCRFLYGMFVSCDFKSSNQPEHLEAFGINHLNKPKYYHILQIEVKDARLFISSAMRFVRVSASYLLDRE